MKLNDASKLFQMKGGDMTTEEIAKMFECTRGATLSKVEFFMGLTLLNVIVMGQDEVEGVGIFTLNKRGGKASLNIELDKKWASLIESKDVESILFKELSNKLGI